MAKLKLDKESLQGFFFNHTEKIVLVVVLLLLVLFVWSGSGLEGIGAQNPAELANQVDVVAKKIEQPTWENIKDEYTPSLDHMVRKEVGDAPTSESYYRLDKPLIGSPPNSAIPRQDPEIFAVTDVEATVVTGPLAFNMRPDWTDWFAELENMEQEKIEVQKKRKKKKKSRGNAGTGGSEDYMEMMMEEVGGEGDEGSMFGPGMSSMEMMGDMAGGASAGPTVRAAADKFHGFRPATTVTTGSSSVVARSAHIVSVKGMAPYQQLWDEYERVFADAAGYMPSRDIPRFLSFRAQRAEVPSDPNEPLKWDYIAYTDYVLKQLQGMGWAGFPGEIADPKYLLPGVLTMPVPPVMMRDLRPLALHSKVPMQEVVKASTLAPVATRELVDLDEVGGVVDVDELPTTPGARAQMVGPGGPSMYGPGGSEAMEDMYGDQGMAGMSGYAMGGVGSQAVRGPQAEFLMVRFFDFIKPGKEYVYRIQVVLEDPNYPQNPQAQPLDQYLADTVRARLAKVAEDEEKQTKAKKTPVRLYTLTSPWSEPTAPVSVNLAPETYAGGVSLPRMLDITPGSAANAGQKLGYSVPLDGEPAAKVMSLNWNFKYAVDLPAIKSAERGTLMNRTVKVNIIDPVTLVYKTIPDYPLATGELVVDLRGGEVLEAAKEDGEPLLTPGEVAVIDASGNLIVRNELDDWQVFDKYAPPPPIVVEAAPSASDAGNEAEMDIGAMEGLYGE